MRRMVVWIAGVFLVLLVIVALRLFLPISTAPFANAPNSIAAVERWDVGGLSQSVIIRGRDRSGPILLWLHGGPGSGQTPVARRFNGDLENDFIVVYWDQRYAGQSYDPSLPLPKGLTIAGYVRDLDVVVDRLRARFHKEKVVLVGQSWGTVLGVLYAQQHPEKVAAYVGIGQVTNTPENEALSYAFVLEQAGARGDAADIKTLTDLGPPPRAGSIFTPRDLINKYGGFARGNLSLGRMVMLSLTAREVNWRDIAALYGAHTYSNDMLNREFAHFTLDGGHPHFDVPMFIMAGRYDEYSVASLAHRFYERLTAPKKEFVWFEESGHNPNFEEPAKFMAFMVKEVRPLAEP
ncbi:MAG TPA: alpha/beta hydrolase [Rhizomicrobium sp.]|jgi:pimeloyl-ACP methyl ester carboxylesterase|nr:alpha/beta hydrolase [Rhizomicrobium sp.]